MPMFCRQYMWSALPTFRWYHVLETIKTPSQWWHETAELVSTLICLFAKTGRYLSTLLSTSSSLSCIEYQKYVHPLFNPLIWFKSWWYALTMMHDVLFMTTDELIPALYIGRLVRPSVCPSVRLFVLIF